MNDDSTDVANSYHNSLIEYLGEYFDDKEDKRKSNREKHHKDMLKKYFNVDTDDMWKGNYKDYLK